MIWIPIVLLVAIIGTLLWAIGGMLIDRDILSWQLMWDYKYPPYHDAIAKQIAEDEITAHLLENPIQHMDVDELNRAEPAKVDAVLE